MAVSTENIRYAMPQPVEALAELMAMQFSYSTPTTFPSRPGPSREGRPVPLVANYFPLKEVPIALVFHYDVTLMDEKNKEVTQSKKNKAVIERFTQQQKAYLKSQLPAYDGRKNLYSVQEFMSPFYEAAVNLKDDPENAGVYKIAVKKAKDNLQLSEIQDYLSATNRRTPQNLINTIDSFLRHEPSINLVTVGRSLYFPDQKTSIGGGVDIWRGFYQSVRPTNGGQPGKGKLMVNVDLSATTFYGDMTVLKFVEEVLPGVARNSNWKEQKLGNMDRARLESRIRNTRVELEHRKSQDIVMRKAIRGVSDMNAFEYRYPNLQLLKSTGASGAVFFPMEVCKIVAGTRYTGPMNDNDRTNMIRATAQKPQMRKEAIRTCFAKLKYARNPQLRDLNIHVDENMVRVPGRVLPAPDLLYGSQAVLKPRDGAWNLLGSGRPIKFYTPVHMTSYGYVLMFQERELSGEQLWEFDGAMRQNFGDTGIGFTHVEDMALEYCRPERRNIETAIENTRRNCQNKFGADPVIIFFVVPGRGEYYADLKDLMDVHLGVPSQVLQLKNIRQSGNKLSQYLNNVALKVNTKLGGINQILKDPPAPFVANSPTMVFGCDVSHYTAQSESIPSIAAVVATMNREMSKYYPTIKLQAPKNEIIVNLEEIVRESLIAFYAFNRIKPERLIFYRDGVSEGQFEPVFAHEVRQIKLACMKLERGYSPKITFIVQTKRHHTKVFVENARDGDRNGNVHAGTVVDSVVTHPFEWDFYLVSHAGIQGTSRPTHYHVLLDENNLSQDVLEGFTHRLCHAYARATRSVSLVPPTYYAHLLAYRARMYVNKGEVTPEIFKFNKNLVPVGPNFQTGWNKMMYYV